MAALLQERAAPGDRVLLLLPSGLDYVAGFYGCLFAGVIAVPAYPPQSTQPQHLERLRLIVEDAEPRLILAEPAMCEAIGDAFGARATVLAAAAPAPDAESAWRRPDLRPDDVAFLQYTSGSTAAPRGVQVTHSNLVANERLIQHGFGLGQGDTMVSWLPLYHDMGLIGGLLQPVFVGYRCVLMSPLYRSTILRHRSALKQPWAGPWSARPGPGRVSCSRAAR
jgi:acyl-CoA synthetase (AMP-forming)/AMP-acid ligase II